MARSRPHELPHVFVAVSSAEEFPALYRVIAGVLDELGLRAVRAEDLKGGGPLDDLFNAIEQAGLVIGLTPADVNVRYELGFAQHLRKEIIVLTDGTAEVPPEVSSIAPLEYSPDDPGGVSGRLAERIGNSRVLSAGAARGILRRGEVFETVVDGTFYLQQVKPVPTKREIYDAIDQSSPMPQRLLYLTEDGREAYLELCTDPGYLYYQETRSFIEAQASSIVDEVLGHCGSSEVDFISLGPGNGHKDGFLLNELLARARDLRYTYYYPYDVSGGLLLETMRNILGRVTPLERLRVKAIEGDVRYLSELKKVFDYREEPNVYSLLGGLDNTSNEISLLTILRGIMNADDCLLLEVRKKAESGEQALGKIELNRQLDLAPLWYVGANVEESDVDYIQVASSSSIHGTRTIAAVAKRLQLGGRTHRKVNLFSVHYYDPREITHHLERVGFRIIRSDEGPNSLFYVCAPAESRP